MFHNDTSKIAKEATLNFPEIDTEKILRMCNLFDTTLKKYSDNRLHTLVKVKEIKSLLVRFINFKLSLNEESESFDDSSNSQISLKAFDFELFANFIENE